MQRTNAAWQLDRSDFNSLWNLAHPSCRRPTESIFQSFLSVNFFLVWLKQLLRPLKAPKEDKDKQEVTVSLATAEEISMDTAVVEVLAELGDISTWEQQRGSSLTAFRSE